MMGRVYNLNVTSSIIVVAMLLLIFGDFQESSSSRVLVKARPLLYSSSSRPRPADAAPFARWLVSHSSWGVLKYVSLSSLLLSTFVVCILLFVDAIQNSCLIYA